MSDVRETVTSVVPVTRMHELLFLLGRTIVALRVDPRRSLAEVNRDYSAMTNLAEYLVRSAGVPFREAHEFASRLTDYGRQHELRPADIAYADAAQLYGTRPLPLSAAEFADALDPRRIIATRRGRGGPQSDEVGRMFAEATAYIAAHQRWLSEKRARLTAAQSALDSAFSSLAAQTATTIPH